MERKSSLLFFLAVLCMAVAGLALVAVRAGTASVTVLLAPDGAPSLVSYQGRVMVSGAPYTGTGFFKFAIVDTAGTTTYWSNDGTSTGGGEPTDGVPLSVTDGLFNVLLGDTSLPNMTQSLQASVFSGTTRHLRVWFRSAGGTFTRLDPDARIAAVPYALQAQQAASVPWSGVTGRPDLQEKISHVVVVAKSGGEYTTIQAALDSITDASAESPYLVWVAPGVYSERVTLKPYVHLQGASAATTVVTSNASSTWPPTQATLVLASNTSLQDLTVDNAGTGERNVALRAPDGTSQALVVDVTVRAQGTGGRNYAVLVTGNSTDIVLEGVTAVAENATMENYGLYNSAGAASTLIGGTFTGRGGNHASGILNTESGTTLRAENIAARSESASASNMGLENTVNGTADVTQSVLQGATASVVHYSGAVTVSHSRLVGAAVSGSVTCVAVSRDTNFSGNSCP